MREIKFRAWDGKKYLYLDMADFEIAYCGVQVYAEFGGSRTIECELEQFTGLKDKNGKDVYEGDIVSRNVPTARAGAIQFAQGIFGINWDYGQNADPLWLEGSMYGSWNGKHNLRPIDDNFMTEKMEVIGNIHENQELLK